MTFASRETSQSSGAPVELFRFVRGPHRWTFTSGDTTETYLGDTYTPISIAHSEPQMAERGKEGASMIITVPRDNPVALQYLVFVPASTMALTIFVRHRGDTETVVRWTGRVRGVQWAGATAELQCESTDAMQKRQALRRGCGYNCEHMLYDQGCGLTATAYRATGNVSSVSGVTLSGGLFGSKPNGWWISGYVRVAQEDYRMVLTHSGSTVTILSPFENLQAGDPIEVYAGCDRTWETCGDKFDNRPRYGGFPFWPVKNPYKAGLI